MTLLPLIAEAIADDVEHLEVDQKAHALTCDHGGRRYVVLVLDVTTTFDRLLDVARRIVRKEPEA